MKTQLPGPKCLLAQVGPKTPKVAARPANKVAAAEAIGACGWFDSSHELGRGLLVQELSTAEGLAAALPLSVWLEVQLSSSLQARRPA